MKPKFNFLVLLFSFLYFSFLFQIDLSASCFKQMDQPLNIQKIYSLSQIPSIQPNQTIYLFDIDDTLFDSSSMLGTKAWRKYILEATEDDSQNWHDIFCLFAAKNYPLRAVEPITSQYVKELQMKGHAVFGLTARERQIWYSTPTKDVDKLTINQLTSVGVDFNTGIPNHYPSLINAPEYFQGVFFADLEPKGEYLLKLFSNLPQLPTKIIFIDDKDSQTKSVAATLDQLGIDYECYTYVATDEKAKLFDPLIANIQLYHLWISNGEQVLSDEEAAIIAKQHPERSAQDYLRALLVLAKASF